MDGDDVADTGGVGELTLFTDHAGLAGAGVVRDIEAGEELDHGLGFSAKLGFDGGCDVGLADGGDVGGDGALDDVDDAPALEAADRTGFHDLDLVADLGLVLLVVDVHDGLAVDDLLVAGMRDLEGDGDLDGLVTGAAGDVSDQGLAGIADGSGHGSGFLG